MIFFSCKQVGMGKLVCGQADQIPVLISTVTKLLLLICRDTKKKGDIHHWLGRNKEYYLPTGMQRYRFYLEVLDDISHE